MKKFCSRFVGLLFASLWLLAAAAMLLPARAWSQNENRFLSQMPDLSGQAVQSGSFQEGMSTYLSDQIPFRSGWIRAYTAVRKLMGSREINGIYLGEDHRYFQKFTDDSYSSGRMLGVLRMMETFLQQQKIPARVMLVPSPGTILRNKLPEHAPYYDPEPVYAAAGQLLSSPVIDLRKAFSESGRDLYYHTDHHWTTEGAQIAYEAYAEAAGLEPHPARLQPVSRTFRGTLDSRVLDLAARDDTVEALLQLPPVRITFEDGTTADTPYVSAKLQEKDQYGFFFGGNYGKVTMDTGAESGRRLLIFKDSFANCFVPFLFEDYSSIVMLDLRYFDGSVAEVIREQGTDEILFLYETSNFLTDNGILKLGKEF